MPTILAHTAVGLAAATFYRGRLKAAVAVQAVICAAIPDIDAVAFVLGIPYHDMLGHRGLSHSLFFAAAMALLLTLLASAFMKPHPPAVSAAVLFLCLFAAGASHGLLDAMTDGGLGIAFFAPFSGMRYFLPWRPIPVSPIAVNAASREWILRVVGFELAHIVLPAAAVMAPMFFVDLFRRFRHR